MDNGPSNQRALDCGAGIGRITKHLLVKHFTKVDLVEQNKLFLEKAKEYLKTSDKVDHLDLLVESHPQIGLDLEEVEVVDNLHVVEQILHLGISG